MAAQVEERRNPNANKAFEALLESYVVVGIPDSTSSRPDSPMNNAQIGYFQEYGSDAQGVPARSWLHSPLQAIQEANVARLEKTSKAALADVKNAKSIIDAGLNRVGLESVSKIIQTIVAHIPPPLSKRTIEERISKNSRGNLAPVASNFTPLIDTGSFKSSITYVIRRS